MKMTNLKTIEPLGNKQIIKIILSKFENNKISLMLKKKKNILLLRISFLKIFYKIPKTLINITAATL